MTTLTRDRSETAYDGCHTRLMLSVSGPAGITALTWYGKADVTLSADLAWHSRELRPGYDLYDHCPFGDGACYSDTANTATKQRVLDAWRSDGDDAAYEVLEELYRQEFGGES